MVWQTLAHLTPYLISLVLSVGIGIYAWRRKDVPGATPFALTTCAEAVWTVGYVLELVSPGLHGKISWDNAQWVGLVAIPPLFLAFSLQYTGRRPPRPRLLWGLLAAASVLSLLLVFTNNLHGLIRVDTRLIPGRPFSALTYEFTISSWLIFLYCYVLILPGYSVLLDTFARPQRLHRAQTGIVLLGSFIPLAGSALPLMGINLAFQRDVAPFSFGIGNLIVAWGLFRYRLFDVIPVAREAVIESMRDAVFVLDAQNRLVDFNHTALAFAGCTARDLIGRPADLALTQWPELVRACQDNDAQDQIVTNLTRGTRHFDLSRSPLYDERDRLTGCLVVLHDVTERNRAQQERERLIGELQTALASIKRLKGLIPVCAYCEKVRDDEGYWHKVEVYLEDHSGPDISTGICPECARLLYSESMPGVEHDEATFPDLP
jgi:PAS domain S-box-containing protein